MDFIYQIALFIDKYSSNSNTLEYHINNDNSEWIGSSPSEIKNNHLNKNSIVDKIQKHQYIHLNIIGENLLEKAFTTTPETIKQDFDNEFPAFNIQNALVSCYTLDESSSIAIFLPKFKLAPIIDDLNKNSIKISSIKISSEFTQNKNCTFQITPKDLTQNNIDRIYFSSFKKVITFGIITLVALSGILYTANSIAVKTKHQNLSDNIDLNIAKHQLDSLNTLQVNQENIIKQNSIRQNTYKYQIINEIALLTPYEITLTYLNLNPTSSKIRNDKPILFSNQTISIHGFSDEIKSIHSWISNISAIEWVSDVTIDEINENRENQKLTFSVAIKTI